MWMFLSTRRERARLQHISMEKENEVTECTRMWRPRVPEFQGRGPELKVLVADWVFVIEKIDCRSETTTSHCH